MAASRDPVGQVAPHDSGRGDLLGPAPAVPEHVIVPAHVRRLRGVYFTPAEVAGYVVRSAETLVREAFSRSLAGCTLIDPALGDGAFARAILAVAPDARILGYEVVPEIAWAARRILPPAVEIRVGSALEAAPRAGGIPVILGNPPWRGHTANPGTVADLLRDWRPPGERNTKWLQDDYVRFLRWATEVVATAGRGLVGFVTNHSWLRGPTHRRMRDHLMEVFDDVRILDLHGSYLRPEPGCRDENVFPVRTGVAVVLMVRSMRPAGGDSDPPRRFALVGPRREKLAWLASHDVASTPWRTGPNDSKDVVYAAWPSLTDLFRVWSIGMVSGQDAKAYFPTRSALLAAHPDLSGDEAFQALYRPGDLRWTAFALHTRPRRKVMRHLLAPGSKALVALRQSGPNVSLRHLVADRPIDNCVLSTESTARAYAYPLRLADGSWNLDPAPLGLDDPEEAFRHIVETLDDPAFQEAHREQLLRDFPRIPPGMPPR